MNSPVHTIFSRSYPGQDSTNSLLESSVFKTSSVSLIVSIKRSFFFKSCAAIIIRPCDSLRKLGARKLPGEPSSSSNSRGSQSTFFSEKGTRTRVLVSDSHFLVHFVICEDVSWIYQAFIKFWIEITEIILFRPRKTIWIRWKPTVTSDKEPVLFVPISWSSTDQLNQRTIFPFLG